MKILKVIFGDDENDKFAMTERRWLICVWLMLLALTLMSTFVAESADPAVWTVLFVSITVTLKGQLVIDRLMGLRHANPLIRGLMLSYFYVLALLIVWALLFPEQLAWLTTL
ncbi:MAG: cytochrome C oxidase subunit IV family protein [Pseudomonadales bacterium]